MAQIPSELLADRRHDARGHSQYLGPDTWGQRGKWEARRPVFQAGFGALDADIVALQETILTDDTDQAASTLGPEYHLAQQQDREQEGQGITTASKWPFGQIFEIDFHLTERTYDFACTCLVTEVLAPEPFARVWVANHFPDYQLDHERERCLQSAAAARRPESLVLESPGARDRGRGHGRRPG